ncbi:MAG: hypothetical protein JXQ73_09510 [Phycisphaerae bacterium]|nr:hypothetical protein [Phycisphaerae bacterium]
MPQADSPTISSRGRGLLGVKDTIESIAVAFVLAFIFRAFVAEAFVIPTGSMAPNLYGIHRMHTCSVCGTEFAYGFSPVHGGRLQPPNTLVCPNCGHQPDRCLTTNPDNGDRIFVLKWLFDVGRLLPDVPPHGPHHWWHVFKPCRWDVVVFKDPNDGTTNFIKRLIGLPGEVLEIIDGDIYTADALELAKTPAGQSVLKRIEEDRASHRDLTQDERRALDHALVIQRKTLRSQRSLWLPAYRQDFLPVTKPTLAGWKPVTDGAPSGWRTDQRQLRFEPVGESPLQEITFSRWQAPVTDVYAYNGSRDIGQLAGPEEYDLINVSDVRLQCLLIPQGGQGKLTLSLSKRDDRFVATLDNEGNVRLTRTSVSRPDAVPVLIGQTRIDPPRPDHPVHIALSNADYRVILAIDDHTLFETTDDQYPVPQDRGASCLAEYARRLSRNGDDAKPEIRLGAQGMTLELWHVAIDRDVYYRSPSRGDRSIGWGTQGQPIYLRNIPERGIGEYYCLGDNSPLSKDSRLWNTIGPHLIHRLEHGDYQYGTVPADQMVGRAFFVYWPAGYPMLKEHFPLVPNVGDMRLIR